jgi:hypothetical protein
MHLGAVVEQPMDWVLRKGVRREVGARRCLLQEDGRCRPASREATSASWRFDFSKFYSFPSYFLDGMNCGTHCVDAEPAAVPLRDDVWT